MTIKNVKVTLLCILPWDIMLKHYVIIHKTHIHIVGFLFFDLFISFEVCAWCYFTVKLVVCLYFECFLQESVTTVWVFHSLLYCFYQCCNQHTSLSPSPKCFPHSRHEDHPSNQQYRLCSHGNSSSTIRQGFCSFWLELATDVAILPSNKAQSTSHLPIIKASQKCKDYRIL